MSSTAFALRDRSESTCTQTVQVPVWYGADYNTCSMQTTTAPCSVFFPTTSCHTARPVPLPESHGMSEFTKLWITIGLAIIFIIIIPVVVLWTRWKLNNLPQAGKRSISIQLEKGTAKTPPKAASGSSSTTSKPISSDNSGRKDSQSLNDERILRDRVRGRNSGNPAQRSYPLIMVISDFQLIIMQVISK